MRTIGVVTVGRSDYGIYRPVLRRIREDRDLRFRLFVTGMHLSPEFGMTVREIEEDGFTVDDCIEALLSSDAPAGLAKSIGLGTIGFAQAYARSDLDILLVLGDRFEMLAAVVAALPFKIPVAHIHGGELTEGAIDDAIRHAITKMSHLHFVAIETYAQRVIQMGEEPWRITVTGAPGLDNLNAIDLLSRQEMEEELGTELEPPVLLVTYHPVTLEYEHTEDQICELLAALRETEATVVFTYPNADTCGHLIVQMLREFAAQQPSAHLLLSLGTRRYFSMMKHASAMVGNSSSGIIEAPSFKIPVVNIGDRQRGRLRADNVIDVGCDRLQIQAAISEALSPGFRDSLLSLNNPYGDGHAAERIVDVLREVETSRSLIQKRFFDIPVEATWST